MLILINQSLQISVRTLLCHYCHRWLWLFQTMGVNKLVEVEKMKKKPLLYGGIALVLLVLAGTAVYAGGATPVDAVAVSRGMISRSVEDTAVVQSIDETLLYAQQAGTVTTVEVGVGQDVQAGQVLLYLENQDLNIQAAQAEMQISQTQAGYDSAAANLTRTRLQLADASKNLERAATLLESGAASQSEYEQALSAVQLLESSEKELLSSQQAAQQQIKALQTTLAETRSKINQLTVTATVPGQVLSVDVKKGQTIMPGQLLASIGSKRNMELKAHILSDDLAEVAPGQEVHVTAPILGTQVLQGSITQIYPRAEEKQSALGVIQRRVPVIISLPDAANLQPGYEVRIAIKTRQQPDVLVLPRQSVRTTSSGSKEVLLIKNNRVAIQAVELGFSDSNHVAITSGLNEGDMVVKDASQDLKRGSRVKPKMP